MYNTFSHGTTRFARAAARTNSKCNQANEHQRHK